MPAEPSDGRIQIARTARMQVTDFKPTRRALMMIMNVAGKLEGKRNRSFVFVCRRASCSITHTSGLPEPVRRLNFATLAIQQYRYQSLKIGLETIDPFAC